MHDGGGLESSGRRKKAVSQSSSKPSNARGRTEQGHKAKGDEAKGHKTKKAFLHLVGEVDAPLEDGPVHD